MSDDGLAATDGAARYGVGLLSGDVVTLRATADEDLKVLAEWWNVSDAAALQHTMVRPSPVGQAEEMFRAWSVNKSGTLDTGFSVVLTGSRELIGHATLYGATTPARAATFAIMVGPEYVGKGYGTEATRMMLRYGFLELGLHRVELTVWAFNTRAIAAYAKAGFVKEGVRRAACFHNGAFHDQVFMGVLAEEFLA
ncbi:GNAT family N-acetyltransferase [Kribbella flavida]|nr:GNAT family protein [Kribbella flavida]